MPKTFKDPLQDNEHSQKAIIFRIVIIGFDVIITLLGIFWIVLPENYLFWIVTICLSNFSTIALLFLLAKVNHERNLRRKAERELLGSEDFRKRVFETSKQTQAQLIHEQMFNQAIMDSVPGMLYLYDDSGHLIRWNKNHSQMTGFTAEELDNFMVNDWFVGLDDDFKTVSEAIQKAFTEGYAETVATLATRKGLIPFHLTGVRLFIGDKMYIAGIGLDITEQKKAEQELKDSEERFKTLSSLASEGLMIHENGIVVDLNQTFANMLGYSSINDLIGKYAPDVIQFTPESKKRVLDHLHRKSDETFDIELINLNGNIIQAETRGIEILYRGRNASLVYMRDISDRKKAERELEIYQDHLEILVKERTEELDAANEELNISNKELYEQREELQASLNRLQETQIKLVQSEKMASLGVLAAGIAHEINNPLNFIRGGATIIETYFKDKLPEMYEEIREVLDGINTGVSRATVIVKSLNQYSRNDDLPYSNCNLHGIIDDCLMILNNQLKNRIEVQKHYTEDDYNLMGNEGKLHQVFLNILANASQAIDNTGTIAIHTKTVNDFIQISISDSGHGISCENAKKVFDPFFTTKEPGKGTGLGLSISYNIIQEHNGTIEFKSKVEAGTEITINLPLKT